MSDALFSASFLNACLRHSDDVSMANIAPSVNTRGPLYVHPKGIVKRTHFHALAMYANKLQPNIVPLEIAAEQLIHEEDSIDVVDAIATLDEKGTTWSIALINRHPSDAINCTVNMGNQPLKGKFSATMLTADSPEAFNSIENPDRVAPKEVELKFDKGIVELPPHSLTIVHIE
jgi:alpha-N-arabinofuranosidase